MNPLDQLDKLRMAAASGNVAAAKQATALADIIEKKTSAPVQFVRRARMLALEAQGYALRITGDSTLIQAYRTAEATGQQAKLRQVAKAVRADMQKWLQACAELAEAAKTDGDDALRALILHVRNVQHLQHILSYNRLASWDKGFQASLQAEVAEGLAEVKQVQEAFKKAGIDEMRLKAIVLEAEWHWAVGARADAVAVAKRLLADPMAASAPDAFDQAANIVAGKSPTPEMDSIPSIDQI